MQLVLDYIFGVFGPSQQCKPGIPGHLLLKHLPYPSHHCWQHADVLLRAVGEALHHPLLVGLWVRERRKQREAGETSEPEVRVQALLRGIHSPKEGRDGSRRRRCFSPVCPYRGTSPHEILGVVLACLGAAHVAVLQLVDLLVQHLL